MLVRLPQVAHSPEDFLLGDRREDSSLDNQTLWSFLSHYVHDLERYAFALPVAVQPEDEHVDVGGLLLQVLHDLDVVGDNFKLDSDLEEVLDGVITPVGAFVGKVAGH